LRVGVKTPSTGDEIWTPHWRLIVHPEKFTSGQPSIHQYCGSFVGGGFGIANAVGQPRLFAS
jgi:hypothetical protein